MNFINTWIAKLIAGLGVIISALLFWRNIKSGIEEDKENEIKAEEAEEVIKDVIEAKEIEQAVSNLPAGDAKRRLFDGFSKKK